MSPTLNPKDTDHRQRVVEKLLGDTFSLLGLVERSADDSREGTGVSSSPRPGALARGGVDLQEVEVTWEACGNVTEITGEDCEVRPELALCR
jgi:hypothetical protein